MASSAQTAKGALRRLAVAQLEPTPENYARAWAEETGDAAPGALPERARALIERLVARSTDDATLRTELARCLMQGQWDLLSAALGRTADAASETANGWAALLERMARGLERGGRQWTRARRKESLRRVLDGSRSDMQRLQQRLGQLVNGWETDGEAGEAVETAFGADLDAELGPDTEIPRAGDSKLQDLSDARHDTAPAATDAQRSNTAWPAVVASLDAAVRAALPGDEPRAAELADELAVLAERIARNGADAGLARELDAVCQRAQRLLAHRHHLVDQLRALCREMTSGLTELAEDESWARGQAAAMQARLDDGFNVRSVRAASELLAQARSQQLGLRAERDRARAALKGLLQSLLQQLGELGSQTGRFSDSLGRYAEVIASADTLDSLAGVVREMVDESRSVQLAVSQTHQRMQQEHAQASELEGRVRELEGELRRLSDEVSTDVLTQVANRRGLTQAFDTERARLERDVTTPDGGRLAVGLIDIDNFKRLNDSLGHAAGDVALKALAARVRDSLRPVDTVARYGGEEFVVLLPGSPVEEAQQTLTRLQRALTASLFMHDQKEVFVTFSAGVTAYRLGERIEDALERADEALYEAKRTGKNRTCVA